MPAAASASRDACEREVATSSRRRRRCGAARMPVRARIHSSLVVDALRELVVGEDLRRQVAAGAGDAAMHRATVGIGCRGAASAATGDGIAAIRCAMLVEHAVRDFRVAPCAARAGTRTRRRSRGS